MMIQAARSLRTLVPYGARSVLPSSRTVKNPNLLVSKIGSIWPYPSPLASPMTPPNTNRINYNASSRRFFFNGPDRPGRCVDLKSSSSEPLITSTMLPPEIYHLTKGPLSAEEMEFYYYQRLKGSILVVGCKTGPLALFLATQQGTTVDAIDPSQEMIKECNKHATENGIHINLYQGSMENFSTPNKYTTIIVPEETFASFLGPQEARAALESVRSHLKPNGKLIIEILVPATRCLDQIIPTARLIDHTYDVTREQGNNLKVSCTTTRKWSVSTKLRVEQQSIVVTRDGETEKPLITLSPYRMYDIKEFPTLLKNAGFEEIEILDPITQPNGALKVVFQAKPPRQKIDSHRNPLSSYL